jgi:hypothetical protein
MQAILEELSHKPKLRGFNPLLFFMVIKMMDKKDVDELVKEYKLTFEWGE